MAGGRAAPQEGQHGGEEGAEEQPETPHLQRKPCGRGRDALAAQARGKQGQRLLYTMPALTPAPVEREPRPLPLLHRLGGGAAGRSPRNVQPHTTSTTPPRKKADPLAFLGLWGGRQVQGDESWSALRSTGPGRCQGQRQTWRWASAGPAPLTV